MKREIETIRLKTLIANMFEATTSPYPKQKEAAINNLAALQEDFKALTGEYCEQYIYIAEGKMNYAEMQIDELAEVLNNLNKKGIKTIQVNGTLLCKDDGNSVILSNEKQM